MAFLNDLVFDNGLNYLVNNTTTLFICSQEPTTYVEASATYALGEKVGPVVNNPVNGTTSGRKVIVDGVVDGTVTASGTATHYALVDNVNNDLLWTRTLNAPVSVTLNRTFTLTASECGFADAV